MRLANGTWTGSLGAIQRGEVDAWASHASINIDRLNDFAMTQPHSFRGYGFLMIRPNNFDINFDAISAGFSYKVFLMRFCVLICLIALLWTNEDRHFNQQNRRTNRFWELMNALIPGDNTRRLVHQSGITRKCVILTCNFTLFMVAVHYSCYILPKLLVPEHPVKITVEDIADKVENGRAELVFTSSNVNGGFETTLMASKHGSVAKLAHALTVHPPIRENNISTVYDLVDKGNGIMLAPLNIIHERLNALEARLCGRYAIVELKHFPVTMRGLIFNKNLTRTVEAMNFIVSQRRDFMQRMLAMFELNDECANYIFPKNALSYKSLQVRSITGELALLAVMMVFGVVVCVLELCVSRFERKDSNVTPQVFLDLRIDILGKVNNEKFGILLQKYEKILHKLPNV